MDNTLDTIAIKGFRSIREITNLKLNPINILVGANGSGKSNIVEVFAFLKAIRSRRMQQYVQQKGSANAILHFGAKTTPQMGIAFSFSSHAHYAIRLNATELDRLAIDQEDIWHSLAGATLQMRGNLRGDEVQASNAELSEQMHIQSVQTHLDGFQVYHFHDVGARSPLKQNLMCMIIDSCALMALICHLSSSF